MIQIVNSMSQVSIAIAPLFIIIVLSAVVEKTMKVGTIWRKALNDFALQLGLPALILGALAKTTFSLQSEASLLISNSLFLILSFGIAIIVAKLLRLNKQMSMTLFICFAFGNIAYLGIPVLTQIYGNQILPTVSIIIAVYLFWTFSIGIGYLDYEKEKDRKHVAKSLAKNCLTNTLLLSVITGLLLSSLQIQIPSVFMRSLDMLAASVTPVVLVVIGLFIGSTKIGKLREWIPILVFSVLTLFILPAGFYVGLKYSGLDPSNFSSSVIEAAMPLAITPFALADKYNLNKTFIARSIVLSTILSAVSLPFWIAIL